VVNYPVDDLLARLIDPGTFRTWDDGQDESVVTAEAHIAGHGVALAASDFSVAGGSIGLVAGERLTRAVERATEERLPLIALPASGGTRMQEGTPAFLQMLKVTAAVSAHKAAGLPYLTYLRHPTTGGVLASWASLGHVTFAEPGALIGFLGPRVYEALEGHSFPAGIQTAEHLLERGIIDAVVPVCNLRARLAAALAAFPPAAPSPWPAPGSGPRPEREPVPFPATDAWDNVLATRQRDRPSAADLLREVAGDRAGTGAAGGLLLGMGRVAGIAVAAAGQQASRACGSPAGRWTWRTARDERSSPSSTRRGRNCRWRPRSTASPGRSPGASPACWNCRFPRSRSCSAREPAAARSPCCPPTGCSRHPAGGSLPSPPKAPAPSSTATPRMPP
jgi:acyl-CoA carboxylase subunit beta